MSARDKFEAWPSEMAKHTPGPWQVTIQADCTSIHSLHGNPICSMAGKGLSRLTALDANAKLIAAAPDLLAALRMWDTFMQNNYRQSDMPDMWQKTVDALAKAGV